MLGKIIARDVNLLFLDEPTNHLDMDSIAALTKAIKAFEGSSIIVTHSEELLREVCDRLIVFANDEAVCFNGTYDEFLEKIGWDDDVVEVKKEKNVKVNKKESKKLRAAIVSEKSKATTPIKKQMQEIEEEIEKLEDSLEDARVKLSRDIPKIEKNIEDKFAQLEALQIKLDVMNKEFEIRMNEV